jgi:ATP-dependent Clp protease adaptor protein ClpS
MSGSATATETKIEVTIPKLYSVVLYNDDFTPMEFVVAVLMRVFNKSEDEAEAIMLDIHNKNKAKIGLYTRDIATTKVNQILALATAANYPLLAKAEES